MDLHLSDICFLFFLNYLLTGSGLRTGSIYYYPSTTYKITGRQRWTPTPMQLQILESIFDQGTGAPSKQKIKEITQKLSHHGQISESNVYNWFQNRRARSKRKQTATTQINSESEAEADLASPNEKMAKIVGVNPYEKLPRRLDNLPRPCSETSSEVSSTDQETNRAQNISMLNDNSNSYEMSFYENFLSNPRSNQLEF